MQWTVRLGAWTSAGEVEATALVTFSRPTVVSTLAEIGLMLDQTKTLLTRLQASVLCGQTSAYAARHRVCAACGVMQPLKDRRTCRVQAEPGARTSFRDAARLLDTLLPASACKPGGRAHPHLEADDRQAAVEVTAVQDEPDKAAAADEHRPVAMLDGAYTQQSSSRRSAPGF